MDEREREPDNPPRRRTDVAGIRRLSSTELFRSGSRVEIDHQGATYRLQITRQGKLILTK
jgi:hemin uptake protein HemP